MTIRSSRARSTSPKALRASMGALVPHGGTPLPEVDLSRDVVFVLGAEREGLPSDVLSRCDVQASIPQSGDAESLNVAMAGTVALYELSRR